jgi:CRISPR-associated endonuclease/helicase Cas3
VDEDPQRQGRSQVTRDALAHADERGRVHLLIDHLSSVAELAHGFGERIGAAEHARLAGLWHDLGKYSANFQKMIREELLLSASHFTGAVPAGNHGR